jgi:hypothetical protein
VPIVAVPLGYQFFGPDALKRFLPETGRADLASFVRPSLLQYYSSPVALAGTNYGRNAKKESRRRLTLPTSAG